MLPEIKIKTSAGFGFDYWPSLGNAQWSVDLFVRWRGCVLCWPV